MYSISLSLSLCIYIYIYKQGRAGSAWARTGPTRRPRNPRAKNLRCTLWRGMLASTSDPYYSRELLTQTSEIPPKSWFVRCPNGYGRRGTDM